MHIGKLHFCAVILSASDVRYTNADLKISGYVWVHVNTIPYKFPILNLKNCRVYCPWGLYFF